MQPLKPLTLSAVATFAIIVIITIATGMWWSARTQIRREVNQLQWEIAHPNQTPR